MPILSVERKRNNSAPTAPKQSSTFAFKFGYEVGLDLRVADCITDDICDRDRDDYAAGIAKGRRELARAERAFAAEQTRDAELMAAEGRSRRRKIG